MKEENGMTATPVEPIVSQPLPLGLIVCGDNVATQVGDLVSRWLRRQSETCFEAVERRRANADRIPG